MFAFREISADESHEYFPLFDWLRFALASIVALSHEHVIGWAPAGNLAVQIFFALSGWLIGGILIGSERSDLPKFYFNRATRIWIPYFGAIALLYAFAALRDGIDAAWIRCIIFDGTFTHNWFIDPAVSAMPLSGTGNHFWSIAVEEQFYLAAPLIIVMLPFGRSRLLWAGVAAVSILTHFWYGAVSLGVLAALTRPQIRTSILGAGAALAALALALVSYEIFAPLFAVLVVLALSASGQKSKVGQFLGGVSYPFYLYHWIGGYAANFLGKRIGFTEGTGLLAYALAVFVGVAAYLAVDRSVMRFRSRYFTPNRGKALMASAYILLASGILYWEMS